MDCDDLYFKTKMGVAGLIFEPHPPNFGNQYIFWMLKWFFDFSTGLRFSNFSVVVFRPYL